MDGRARKDGILGAGMERERRVGGGATRDLRDQVVGSGGRVVGTGLAVFEAMASNCRDK
jgi:hypothetical protein